MRQKVTLLVLMFASMVAMLPNSVLFPVEHSTANHLHQSLSFIGWMVTSYAIAYICATPVLGVLSDFFGRKRILLFGLCLFALGGMVPMVSANGILILLGRFLMGVGSAGIQPMVDSVIGDIYEPGPARRRAFAVFAATIAIAEALMPFLGGLVGTFWWKGVFALYGSALLVMMVLPFIILPSHLSSEGVMTMDVYRNSMRIAARIPQLSVTVLGAMIFGVVYFGVSAMLPMTLLGPHTPLTNGLLFLPIGFFWVLGAAVFARVPHLRRIDLFASLAMGLLAVATVALGFGHHVALVITVGSLWGIGSAFTTTLFTWVIGDESPSHVRGAMNGIYNAAYVFGFSIGAPLFIGLANWLGLRTSCIVGALVLALFAPCLYLIYRRGLRVAEHLSPNQISA